MNTNKNNKEVVKTNQNPLINKTKQQLVEIIKTKDNIETVLRNTINEKNNEIKTLNERNAKYNTEIKEIHSNLSKKYEQIIAQKNNNIEQLTNLTTEQANALNEEIETNEKQYKYYKISLIVNTILIIAIGVFIGIFV